MKRVFMIEAFAANQIFVLVGDDNFESDDPGFDDFSFFLIREDVMFTSGRKTGAVWVDDGQVVAVIDGDQTYQFQRLDQQTLMFAYNVDLFRKKQVEFLLNGIKNFRSPYQRKFN